MISPQFKPLVGGYERACERLSVALAGRGHDVMIWAERRDKAWPRHERVNGVRVRRGWCIYRPGWHMVTSMLGLAGFLLWRGRGFEVWHVHQYGTHAALALALGGLLRRKVVLKLTGSSEMGLAKVLAAARFPRLLAALHRRTDAVVALTRETAAEAEAFGIPGARVHILGNGIDARAFKPVSDADRQRSRQALGLAETSMVLFVGRLAREKNISGLLQAWALARPALAGQWVLVLVGDGPQRSMLEAEASALALGASVRFVGQQANVVEWLAAASVYVQSSDHEGLSNTMLEAMATGLPVVVTRVSGTSELVHATGSGRVVEVGDMDALAAALRELAGSAPQRFEMGVRGRHVIEERYAVDRVAAAHADLYEQLVQGRR
ncbi:MAG: glycosyltransferase family 4 protein [Lautropia sp.]